MNRASLTSSLLRPKTLGRVETCLVRDDGDSADMLCESGRPSTRDGVGLAPCVVRIDQLVVWLLS